jgi:hypothetical protein
MCYPGRTWKSSLAYVGNRTVCNGNNKVICERNKHMTQSHAHEQKQRALSWQKSMLDMTK